MNDETPALRPAPAPRAPDPILDAHFADAFAFARAAHATQARKGTRIPYLAHLMAVAALVLEHGGDQMMAIAALLLDAPEDQGGRSTLEAIRTRFGDRVAEIVEGCTDSITRGRSSPTFVSTGKNSGSASTPSRRRSTGSIARRVRYSANDSSTIRPRLWPKR